MIAADRVGTVPVEGGELTVAEWGDPAAEPLLAIHGITASHLAWLMVAEHLPERRIIAPDLRGRGRSDTLPGPYGMPRHASDLVAVLDGLGLDRVQVTGHSMGAFVAVAMAAVAPERVTDLVLVDGGMPFADPPGGDVRAAVTRSLGPALARLTMTFPDREAYRAFWAKTPAFLGGLSPEATAYVDYDLVGEPPQLHAATAPAAVAQDSLEFYGEQPAALLAAVRAPTRVLTAPRGLQGETPGLYSAAAVAGWEARFPFLRIREVPDVDHYAILMSARGAAEVVAEVRSA